ETVRKFVESLRPASAAQLDFVHVLLPHSPWQFLGDGQNYGPERRPTVPGILTPELRWRDEFAATSMRQRHLLQVQVADALLGRIVDKLRRIGAYDESLLIVTADHGATFSAGQQLRGLSQTSYPEIMWAPLFVKAPDEREGILDDTSVRSIDVLPTIADHLDITLPWQTDGRSAMSEPRSEGRLRISSTIWDDEPPPAGSDFHEFDGAAGFARVLRARAGDGGASDGLQLYRTGPFGRLVGTPAAPHLEAGTAAVAATFAEDPDFDHVDPEASEIPWAELRGTVAISEERQPLAVTVNGVVAAVTETSGQIDDDRTAFAAILPPKLFRHGKNDVRLYAVRGTPTDPRLVATRRGSRSP
ncbi:MAG: sulfatase-like hydrolase/transferase, partial [Acidimicrobiia bacterium]